MFPPQLACQSTYVTFLHLLFSFYFPFFNFSFFWVIPSSFPYSSQFFFYLCTFFYFPYFTFIDLFPHFVISLLFLSFLICFISFLVLLFHLLSYFHFHIQQFIQLLYSSLSFCLFTIYLFQSPFFPSFSPFPKYHDKFFLTLLPDCLIQLLLRSLNFLLILVAKFLFP